MLTELSRLRCTAAVLLAFAGLAQLGLAQQSDNAELEMLPVQGNVYMLSGAGGNIAVQIGSQGTLIVDTGSGEKSDKVIAAIRKLTPKPIQYIINTSADRNYAGGNDALRRAGVTYTGANVSGDLKDLGSAAQVFAHDNVLQRMSAPSGVQAPTAFGDWPTQTFIGARMQMSFNGEAVEILHQPAAHTDGDSFVVFRRSDVIVAGDIFLTTTYPFIDLEHGGSIQGEIDALNTLVETMVPLHEEEGGTYVIPGHGRIVDRFEVVEYRDMVTIVRDRIRAAIKKGMTLDQVKAARLTLDYDYRYGAKTGPGTTDQFVESVYKSLTKK
jgi:glyoxylase-like metal-dependent hydrolase (beta-lactamase superfamily II)